MYVGLRQLVVAGHPIPLVARIAMAMGVAISQRALSQVELLNQQISALRRQIGALESALEASESRDRESQTKIADLGRRLNVALAQRVQELSRYRSDFPRSARQRQTNRFGVLDGTKSPRIWMLPSLFASSVHRCRSMVNCLPRSKLKAK